MYGIKQTPPNYNGFINKLRKIKHDIKRKKLNI